MTKGDQMGTVPQWQKVFWNAGGMPYLPLKPTEEDIRVMISPNYHGCALNDIIYGSENEGNMRILRRFAFTAMKRHNHSCRGCNFGIYAQSGQGKTYVVKQFAKTVGLPFIFVQPTAINNTARLFEMICEECDDFGTPIRAWKPKATTKADYTLPPIIIFFDEAHALPRKMMTGGLLNAMEADDGHMVVKQGASGSVLVDCKDVCWIGATTERGKLFDAFSNRLGTDIEWRSAGLAELALIVQQKMVARLKAGEIPFDMPLEFCRLAAHYRRVPREAINFALKMIQQVDMIPSDTWEDAGAQVAVDLGLDEWGFSEKQVAILTALGQRPIAEGRLSTVARCRIEQVQQYELPMMMAYTHGGPLMISTSRGMCITEAGLAELDKRGIKHNGREITAERFEEKRRLS
jgi:Holliday junction resolvasome RuvABC ATP-dependent DNA helicase subunit